MSLHPEISQYLDQLKEVEFPDACTASINDIRNFSYEGFRPRAILQHPDVTIKNETIKTDDRSINIRLYCPNNPSLPLPGLVYLHGGGFVCGSLDHYDPFCIDIAKTSRAVVISIDYRLAPEFRYPIPLEDSYAVARWLKIHSQKFNINPEKFFIAGDSAGGCLTAATALLANDRDNDLFAGQILLWPMLDIKQSSASFQKYDLLSLPKLLVDFFWQQYIPQEKQTYTSYLSPTYTEDFTRFPRSLIITTECDVLVDEGQAFAKNLQLANKLHDYHSYEGMVHGFIFLDQVSKAAKAASEDLVKRIAQFIYLSC